MTEIFRIIAWTVTAYLSLLNLMLVLRVLFPLFVNAEESKMYSFIYATTEPFLIPVRSVLSRFEFFASSPVDFTYIIALMLIMIIQLLLPTVY